MMTEEFDGASFLIDSEIDFDPTLNQAVVLLKQLVDTRRWLIDESRFASDTVNNHILNSINNHINALVNEINNGLNTEESHSND